MSHTRAVRSPDPDSNFCPSGLQLKIEALSAYEHTFVSEIPPYPHPRSYEAVQLYARRHGVTVGLPAAEPFMLVRQLL